MKVVGSSVHSCYTALSNYSTTAATQVMEFQLKFDSFQNLFLLARDYARASFHGLEKGRVGAFCSQNGRRGESTMFFFFFFKPSTPFSIDGEWLTKTLLFRGTLQLEPKRQEKGKEKKNRGVLKVFKARSQKWRLWLIVPFQEQLHFLLCKIQGCKR